MIRMYHLSEDGCIRQNLFIKIEYMKYHDPTKVYILRWRSRVE